jgi:hypothetical protein
MKRTASRSPQLRLRRALFSIAVVVSTAWLTAMVVGWLANGIAHGIH